MIALRPAPRRKALSSKTPALTAGGSLIDFLSKLAILRLLPSSRAGLHHTCTRICSGPPLQPGRLLTSIYAGGFSSLGPEARGCPLTVCPRAKRTTTEDLVDRAAAYAEKIYVSRGVLPGYASLCQRVYLVQGLCAPQLAGHSGCQHNEDPGARGML